MYYLRVRQKYRLDLEPTYTAIVYENFETKKDWVEFYGYVKEAIPPNAPMHPGKSIDLWMMIASDHAGDKITRRSRTGLMIFVNLALINWL